jgi:hypothetical protein
MAPAPASPSPEPYRLVLRAYLFTDLAAFVEKLDYGIPPSSNADDYAIVTLFIFNPQRSGFVG